MNKKLATPFEIIKPQDINCALLFNSPHSGRHYPKSFLDMSHLNCHDIRKSEDAFVDELFSFAPEIGACLMHAFFPRAYLDLNREAYELDAAMFKDPLPKYVNIRSSRARMGLGTIARKVTESLDIYKGPLDFDEVRARIETLYFPYHQALEDLLDDLIEKFGHALLIDCHSMPANPFEESPHKNPKADIILGNNFNRSCNGAITDLLEYLFAKKGYLVEKNYPYAGGYITQTYGMAQSPRQSIQIEINRSLYMNEEGLELHAGFETVSNDLRTIMLELKKSLPEMLEQKPIAAE